MVLINCFSGRSILGANRKIWNMIRFRVRYIGFIKGYSIRIHSLSIFLFWKFNDLFSIRTISYIIRRFRQWHSTCTYWMGAITNIEINRNWNLMKRLLVHVHTDTLEHNLLHSHVFTHLPSFFMRCSDEDRHGSNQNIY